MPEYSQILYVKDLPELDALAYRLQALCDADGAPIQASRIRQAYITALNDLATLARRIADEATIALKRNEHDTRVRPDTGGGGGPRLEDYLEAHVLAALPGSVGFADEDQLDHFVPWWVTNEVGSHARVGGVIYGHFFDQGWSNPSAPSPGQFREHPLFAPDAGPGAGRGVIRNPIPARRFILKTTEEIDPLWHDGVRTIRARLEAEWQAALDLAAAQAQAGLA